MSILKNLRLAMRMSERELSELAGVSRATIRKCETNPTLVSPIIFDRLASYLGYKALVAPVPATAANSEYSTIAVSLAVVHDGFSSWKIHFFNLVDEFRRTPDLRLVMLPPTKMLDEQLTALLASIVCTLCSESGYNVPDWAAAEYFLKNPWFVSGMESLKASAVIESPYEFRRNNIFVQANILKRA